VLEKDTHAKDEMMIETYWQTFLATLPSDSPYRSRAYIAESFGDTPDLADELGALVLEGIKTGTCSALWEWEAEGKAIPAPGFICIMLDGAEKPICIIETIEVAIRCFDEVDELFAGSEGEGDLSLAFWRQAHENFFKRTLPVIGRQFSRSMPLVCETFRVIYRGQPA